MISLIILITLYIVWGVISVRDLIKKVKTDNRVISYMLFFITLFIFTSFTLLVNAMIYLDTL